jgi:hypothetical protein
MHLKFPKFLCQHSCKGQQNRGMVLQSATSKMTIPETSSKWLLQFPAHKGSQEMSAIQLAIRSTLHAYIVCLHS